MKEKTAKRLGKMLALLALTLLMPLGAFSQVITVKGTVSDSHGESVIGATVVEKGNTKNATVTDLDGNFTLQLHGSQLVVSYIGMKTKTVNVAGKKTVSIVLEDDNTTLNDVVVIGYGSVRKKDLTGSVSTVRGGGS